MRLVPFVLVAGCWRGSQPPPVEPQSDPRPIATVRPRGAPCEQVADNVRRMLSEAPDQALVRRADALADAVRTRCAADAWSMELRRCLGGAATLDDSDGCEGLMTAEQEQAFEHEVELVENAD